MSVKILDCIMYKSFLLIAVFGFLTACTYTKSMSFLPNVEDVEVATIQEYSNGTPVSREISLNTNIDTITLTEYRNGELTKMRFNNHILDRLFQWGGSFVRPDKESVDNVPIVEESYLFRLKLLSGEVRTFFVYAKGEEDFIEEPRLGIYSKSRTRGIASFYYVLTSSSYLYLSLNDAFGGENFSILPEYNGAGKAIWVDFRSGGIREDPLAWPNRYIPETKAAKRAEDVRYIVAYYDAGRTYRGYYWYNPKTRERTNAYDYKFNLIVYDLLKGDTTALGDVQFNKLSYTLNEYFSHLE